MVDPRRDHRIARSWCVDLRGSVENVPVWQRQLQATMDKDADVEGAIGLERQRWAEVEAALSERTAALTEEQRQIRLALVEYFSILQEWAHEDAIAERAVESHLDQATADVITEPSKRR
jgi:hypothetical protein